jgi:hypothetical protein
MVDNWREVIKMRSEKDNNPAILGELNRVKANLELYRNRMLDYNQLLLKIHVENRSRMEGMRDELTELKTMNQQISNHLTKEKKGIIHRLMEKFQKAA